ncbi:hypothetical protein [Psychrobacter sp.]|uniref:hypothetical protein n=1 Tax=Psychrobacter sp. TaxID=56811 RepID=UPI00356AD86B
MNKLIITPIALSLLASVLIGCGEGEDAIFGSGGSNELTVSTIERSSNAIARIDTTYNTGARRVKKINIVGSYDQNLDDLDLSVVLGDKFEGTLEDKHIEVDGRLVKRPIYEKNSSNKLKFETIYRTRDLSGVDARDYDASNSYANRRGIFTDLNNYTKIPNNIGFPSGSICYIPVVTSERSFFVFDVKDKTGFKTLDNWVSDAEQRFNDKRQSSTTRINIGFNNSQKAAQVKFFAVNNDPEYIYNGVNYDGGIYEADFVNSAASIPNQDSIRGVVDCTIVNKVAADFLATQITKHY